MNELNKLIQQYETENPGKKVKGPFFDEWEDEFVEWLASRPTCGKEQRKFLDEVEKMQFIPRKDYNHDNVFPDGGWIEKGETIIDQDDFESDIEKVIKGE